MANKFDRLDVWQLPVEYFDLIYQIAEQLPKSEEYNLKNQNLIKRRNDAPVEAVPPVYVFSEKLSIKLQAFRNALN